MPERADSNQHRQNQRTKINTEEVAQSRRLSRDLYLPAAFFPWLG